MKKLLLSLVVGLYATLGFAQVGVDTDTPTEKLDVNGTVRVQNLPLNGSTATITTLPDGTSGVNDFTATRTIVADVNGVLGYVDGINGAGSGTEVVDGNGNPIYGAVYGVKRNVTVVGTPSTRDFSDAIVLQSGGCLKMRLDPNNDIFGADLIDVYFAIDNTVEGCPSSSYASAVLEGGDNITPNTGDHNYWRGTLTTDWTFISGFQDYSVDTPLRFGRISLLDIPEAYSFEYWGVNNDIITYGGSLKKEYGL